VETAKGKSRDDVITKLAQRIDNFERYSRPHAQAMTELALRLARRFGLAQPDLNAVAEAALLHDIGLQVMSPPYYLSPEPLSFEERVDLWRHPIIGEQQMAKRDATRHAQLLVRWHHEWWNGSGYPDMLAFEDIPIGARILRAVELYCALTSARPYRQALSDEQTIETLRSSAGIECDPYVVKALLALLDDLREEQAADEPPVEAPAAEQAARQWPEPAAGGGREFWPEAGQGEPGAPPPFQVVAPARQDSADRPRLLPAIESLGSGAAREPARADEGGEWHGWRGSRYNKKSLLAFEASVLRQIDFRSIAVPFCGWARLDWYLKLWGKVILSNDPRAWAAAVSRAMIEAKAPLGEEQIIRLLEDIYVPGTRLRNAHLSRWFTETDAWWLDNLRRNVEAIEDESLRAQAIMLGLQTGDYALSFDEETRDLRWPLTTIFWRLAGRVLLGPPSHPHNRSSNEPAEHFIKQTRADLLYLSLPPAHTEQAGSEARSRWREAWVRGAGEDAADEVTRLMTAPQSKQAYLAMVDRMLRAAAHIKVWAVGYQEVGLASARDISELIKEHRPVRATYSKDLTEVAGGLRSYIIVADKA
jgi:ribosomal protein L12E/L44/L45/RPP1/RPP2